MIIPSLIFSLFSRFGLNKLPWKMIGVVAVIIILAGSHIYSYYTGKSVMKNEIEAAQAKKEKENAQALAQIHDEASVIEVNTLKDRFEKEQAINTNTAQQLTELNTQIPAIDVSKWTCENLQEQRAQQAKRDEQRARILVLAQWRTYCIGSSDPRCKDYIN